jgi:hypothetical protein
MEKKRCTNIKMKLKISLRYDSTTKSENFKLSRVHFAIIETVSLLDILIIFPGGL